MQGAADVILVDGFDAAGMPAELGSAAFYAGCRRALREGGVLAANILSYDPCHDLIVERIQTAFGGHACDFRGIAGNNHLLFAVRAGPRMAGPRMATPRMAGTRAAGLAARIRRWRGLHSPFLNRLLARALVAWLTWRPV